MSFNPTSKVSLPLTVSYTYTDSRFLSDFDSEFEGWGTVNSGDQLPYLANHQLTGTLAFNYKKFGFNISGRYLSDMRTEPGQGDIAQDDLVPEVVIFDASLNVQMSKNIGFFANALNIGDKKYLVARRPAGLRPGLPRTYNAGIKVQF